MGWEVRFHDEFENEFEAYTEDVQDSLLAAADKQGKNQKLFYKRLIKIADRRFDLHLQKVAGGKSTRR